MFWNLQRKVWDEDLKKWLHHDIDFAYVTKRGKSSPETSHKGIFLFIKMYTLSESRINKLSIDVWFVRIIQYLAEIQLFGEKNQNIEKIAFKVVQMKFLAMHITNKKIKFWYIYSRRFTKYLHGTWSLLNILMIFGIKEK